jgi:hypothetical protein
MSYRKLMWFLAAVPLATIIGLIGTALYGCGDKGGYSGILALSRMGM